jgi:tetratricopeptide (TPR) repeat protein
MLSRSAAIWTTFLSFPDLRTMLRTSLLLLFALPFAAFAQNDALAHLDQSRKAYVAEDYATALLHADSAIALDESLPGALKLRGDIKQRQNNLHGALVDYTKAERIDANDPRLYVSRSAIYITEGRLKEAFRDTDKALKLDPNDADALYNRACASYLGQANEAALRDLERSLKIRPGNADALFLSGVVKGELYKEDAGLADIQAALALNPKLAGARMSAAVLLFEMKRYEEAIQAFTEVIDEQGTDLMEAYYYRADSHYNLENKDSACADWRKSAELGDKDAVFVVRNYCLTEETKIPKKPVKKSRKTVIEF